MSKSYPVFINHHNVLTCKYQGKEWIAVTAPVGAYRSMWSAYISGMLDTKSPVIAGWMYRILAK